MENLAAAHALNHPPLNISLIPKEVMKGAKHAVEAIGCAIPYVGTASKMFNIGLECMRSDDAPSAPIQTIRETRAYVEKYLASEVVPLKTETTMSSSASTAVPQFDASASLINLCQQTISSCLGSVLMSVFTSDETASSTVAAQLQEVYECIVVIGHAVERLRTDMHSRFDSVDRKLDLMHADTAYFAAETQRRLERLLDTGVSATLRHVTVQLDAVLLPVQSLQSLCGDTLCALQWDAVIKVLRQFERWAVRYGDRHVPADTLQHWLVTIEDVLLCPPVTTTWMNRAYFLRQPHTLAVDAHLSNTTPADALGWLLDKPLVLPFSMGYELARVYADLRVLARQTNLHYDVGRALIARIIASFHDVVLEPDLIRRRYARLQQLLVEIQAKVKSVHAAHTQPTVTGAALRRWRRAFEVLNVLHCDSRVVHYYNCNNEQTGWYENQQLAKARDVTARQFAEAGDSFALYVSVDPAQCELLVSKRPIILQPTSAAHGALFAYLQPYVCADVLEWGSLHLHVTVNTHAGGHLSRIELGSTHVLVMERIVDSISCLYSYPCIVHWTVCVYAVWVDVYDVATTVGIWEFNSHTMVIPNNEWINGAALVDNGGFRGGAPSPVTGSWLLDIFMNSEIVTAKHDAAAKRFKVTLQERLDAHIAQAKAAETADMDASTEGLRADIRRELRWLSLVTSHAPYTRGLEQLQQHNYADIARAIHASPAGNHPALVLQHRRAIQALF